MPRTSIRSLARSLAANGPALETVDPPEPEKLARGDETTGRSADTVEVEGPDSRSAASDPSPSHPAPLQGGKSFEGPAWQEEFASPEELYRRFKNVDSLRGRLASELGQLRRQVGLTERTVRLLLATRDPFERQALLQAIGLIHEPKTWPSIEQMLDAGEEMHEPMEVA